MSIIVKWNGFIDFQKKNDFLKDTTASLGLALLGLVGINPFLPRHTGGALQLSAWSTKKVDWYHIIY